MNLDPERHDFPVQSTKDVYVGRVMALRSDEVVMPGGRTAVREILEHPGAVAIAALDADDRLMMIYQYRHAVRRRLWELPAGLLDVAGEDPVETARRELAEEAGLAATDWSVLVDMAPSPGFSDESVRVYLARGLSEVARPDLGDDEEADLVHRLDPAQCCGAHGAGRGDRQRDHRGRGARGARHLRGAGGGPSGRCALAGPPRALRATLGSVRPGTGGTSPRRS